jgi:4-alpha-glucanotransferase
MNHCNDINVNIGIMEYCMKCKAKMVVITVQDILGVDDSARVNVPGTISNKNWTWKLTDFEAFRERIKDFKK